MAHLRKMKIIIIPIKNRVDVLDVPDCEDHSGRPDCRVAHDVRGGRHGNGPGNAHLDHNVRPCG